MNSVLFLTCIGRGVFGKLRAVFEAADACPSGTLCMEFHIVLGNL